MIHCSEWCGSIIGLLGDFLLATPGAYARWGWVAFLVANIALIAFAVGIGGYGLRLQQVGFTATSLLGLRRSRAVALPVAPTPSAG